MKNFFFGIRDFLIYVIPGSVFIFVTDFLFDVFNIGINNSIINSHIFNKDYMVLYILIFGYVIGVAINAPLDKIGLNKKIMKRILGKSLNNPIKRERYSFILDSVCFKGDFSSMGSFWLVNEIILKEVPESKEHIERINILRNSIYNLISVFMCLIFVLAFLVIFNWSDVKNSYNSAYITWIFILFLIIFSFLWVEYYRFSKWLVNTIFRMIFIIKYRKIDDK